MKLKKYRAQKYTQKEMAMALNLSERQYRRIEKGTSLPNILTAMQIADMLNVYDLRKIWDFKPETMTRQSIH